MTHYTHNSPCSIVLDLGNDWTRKTFDLREGDTAYAPGTSKKVYSGPGTLTYLIHPSSVTVEDDQGLTLINKTSAMDLPGQPPNPNDPHHR